MSAADVRRLIEQATEWTPPTGEDAPGVVLADIQPECVDWLWPGRLARGKVTLLDGDPGLGKSAIALDMAARLTRGAPWPDGSAPCAPVGVVLLTAEDGLADTVRPRVDAAGGDPSKILTLDLVGEDRHPVTIPDDLPHIERAVRAVGAGMVVVDPLMAHLNGGVNAHRDQDVRRALRPLADTAARLHAAVLVIRHLNKQAGGQAIYRGGGSIGLIGAARIGLLVGRAPDDERRHVLACTKNNLAPMPPALSYELEEAANGAVRIGWRGAVQIAAQQLVAQPDSDDGGALTEARAFLREVLADGPVPARDVQRDADAAGIAGPTLRRARVSLGVRVTRRGVAGRRGGGEWFWVLADLDDQHHGFDHLNGLGGISRSKRPLTALEHDHLNGFADLGDHLNDGPSGGPASGVADGALPNRERWPTLLPPGTPEEVRQAWVGYRAAVARYGAPLASRRYPAAAAWHRDWLGRNDPEQQEMEL